MTELSLTWPLFRKGSGSEIKSQITLLAFDSFGALPKRREWVLIEGIMVDGGDISCIARHVYFEPVIYFLTRVLYFNSEPIISTHSCITYTFSLAFNEKHIPYSVKIGWKWRQQSNSIFFHLQFIKVFSQPLLVWKIMFIRWATWTKFILTLSVQNFRLCVLWLGLCGQIRV